jgi:hypothetical protein
MTHLIEYFRLESGESIGHRETTYSSGEPECPNCGAPLDYEEFVTGQDLQGNEEYSCRHLCFGCMLGTAPVAL